MIGEKKTGLKGHRSTQFFFILTLLALLTTVVSTFLVYNFAYSGFRRRAEITSHELLNQTMTVFDSLHQRLVRSLVRLSGEPSVYNLLYADSPDTRSILRAADRLDDTSGVFPHVDSLIGYNQQAELFFSTKYGLLSLSDQSMADINKVLSDIRTYGLYQYIPLLRKGTSENSDKESLHFAMVVGTIPYNGSRMSSCLIALIDERLLRSELFGDYESLDDGTITIINDEGLIVSHKYPFFIGKSASEIVNISFDDNFLNENERQFLVHRDGEDYVSSLVKHPATGWYFLRQVSLNELLYDLKLLRATILTGVGIFSLFVFFINYLLSRILSRPLERLARDVRQLRVLMEAEDTDIRYKHELAEVGQVLMLMKHRVEQLKAGEELTRENLYQRQLRQWIESPLGPSDDGRSEDLWSDKSGSVSFSLLVVSVDAYRKNLLKQGREYIEQVRKAVIRAGKEASGKAEYFSFFFHSDQVVLLLKHEDEREIGKSIEEMVESIRRVPHSLTIAYSLKGWNVEDLSQLHELLREGTLLRFFEGEGLIINVDERDIAFQGRFLYPLDAFENILHHTFSGSTEEAIKVFDSIFTKTLTHPASATIISRLLAGFLYTETTKRFGRSVEFPPDFIKLISFPDYIDTLEEFRRIIALSLESIVSCLALSTGERHRELVGRVQELVQSEYSNPNFSDDLLAEMLNLSTQHLRSVYRKYTGESVSKTILSHRLEEAKRLLLTTELPAKEIAPLVGMGNANYFLTLFRKEFGMSPTNFRRRS